MPELPEIQAHAERLTEDFSGHVLGAFRSLSFTALKTAAPDPADATGHALENVTRRGKYLVLDFEIIRFIVHLMQGGRLIPDEKQSPKARNGLARWVFEEGPALLLTEASKEKRAGVWVLPATASLETTPPTDRLGPDADRITREQLAIGLATNSMRLHGFLRDQSHLAGIGRRLANEICHRARVSPFANTAKLDDESVDAIFDAIASCIAESLAYERTRDNMSSSKERPGEVHHRAGEACPVCGDSVRAVKYSSYTVNYCATCQTSGKILADNTTSRFLK